LTLTAHSVNTFL